MLFESKSTHKSDLMQPLIAGCIASIIGFASSFSIVLQGLTAVGASASQAASGLFVLCLGQGVLAIYLGVKHKQPISLAWSTPGAALLMGSAMPEGGFGVAVLAFIITGLLIALTGIWKPLSQAVAAIPMPLANAMLAGILMNICLAPVHAVADMPILAGPIIGAWFVAWLWARRYATLIALVVTAIVVFISSGNMPSSSSWLPPLEWISPVMDLGAALSIALPLYIVTMASQNVPGVAVMKANGYNTPVRESFITTGLLSGGLAFFGGHVVNLSAITAALCAGPEAGPNKEKRYFASIGGGLAYIVLGISAGIAATFVTLSPPILIQCLAGLALLSSLASAITAALENPEQRLAALITFVVAASGVTILGVGAAFWGVLAGALMLVGEKLAKR